MSLANLFNVPTTPQEWAVWSFSHADQHRLIIRAVREQQTVDLTEFILDPIPFHALDGWVWNHQKLHNDMDGVLKLGGFDLTGLDPEDAGQVAAWIRLNAIEHQLAARKLNI